MEIYIVLVTPKSWKEYPNQQTANDPETFDDIVDRHIKKYEKAWKSLAKI